jgi:hypothetical protein
VDHGPKGHRVCHLSVEPEVLIGGEEPREPGAKDANDIAEHRDQDKATIKREDEASTPRCPDGKLEGVQGRQPCVHVLMAPKPTKKGGLRSGHIPGCTSHKQREQNEHRRIRC